MLSIVLPDIIMRFGLLLLPAGSCLVQSTLCQLQQERFKLLLQADDDIQKFMRLS